MYINISYINMCRLNKNRQSGHRHHFMETCEMQLDRIIYKACKLFITITRSLNLKENSKHNDVMLQTCIQILEADLVKVISMKNI
jgi:hypothetical protein